MKVYHNPLKNPNPENATHIGEPVTYAVFDKTGKLRFVAPNEHDAHMALILSSADPDEFDVETMVKPLYASPVQPDHIADVGKMIDPLSIGDK